MTLCSCGVPACAELGWPHTWDPVAVGDDCVVGGLGENPHRFARYLGGWRFAVTPAGHKVASPYVRYGSGYACAGCVEAT